MTDAIRPLIAGNWKMNGLKASMAEFEAMIAGAGSVIAKADLLVCPPATLLALFAEVLADAGASFVIVGHSERRADHGESDALVRQKAEAAWRAGLVAIVCIGETRAERDADKTLHICGGQLEGSLPDGSTGGNLVVAYEPVWAIGTGLTPTSEDVEQVHRFIREALISRFTA